jgi:signal transduction histidine kinase
VAASSLPEGGLFLPILLACLGGALIWRQATETERGRLRSLSRTSLTAGSGQRLGRVRLAAGAALVVAGAVLVLARADFTALRDGALATVVTVVGLALITGPWWMRMATQLSTERAERIRSQERADIAAHLHDSVLQTLALIQRNADVPREVVRLARGQERELRTLLYESRQASGQLAEQFRTMAGEVEDAYAIKVDVVCVGDVPVDDDLAALAAAAREALVNAAKHAGVASVSLYAEVEPDEVSVFVKDRGVGFDPAEVAADRQGLRASIQGRVERHGGTARVRSQAGEGTEVELRMPRRAST